MSDQSPSRIVLEKSVKQLLVINKGEEECYCSSMGAALQSHLKWKDIKSFISIR